MGISVKTLTDVISLAHEMADNISWITWNDQVDTITIHAYN